VPLSVIRRFARQVAARFDPEKIVLFSAHTPTLETFEKRDLLSAAPLAADCPATWLAGTFWQEPSTTTKLRNDWRQVGKLRRTRISFPS
jgi:hypothetical protein